MAPLSPLGRREQAAIKRTEEPSARGGLFQSLEQERQTKEAVLARVENILNSLQEVDRN